MNASPETLEQADKLPVSEVPTLRPIPEWDQFPLEKRHELVQVLAGMLLRQVQKQSVKHERPS